MSNELEQVKIDEIAPDIQKEEKLNNLNPMLNSQNNGLSVPLADPISLDDSVIDKTQDSASKSKFSSVQKSKPTNKRKRCLIPSFIEVENTRKTMKPGPKSKTRNIVTVHEMITKARMLGYALKFDSSDTSDDDSEDENAVNDSEYESNEEEELSKIDSNDDDTESNEDKDTENTELINKKIDLNKITEDDVLENNVIDQNKELINKETDMNELTEGEILKNNLIDQNQIEDRNMENTELINKNIDLNKIMEHDVLENNVIGPNKETDLNKITEHEIIKNNVIDQMQIEDKNVENKEIDSTETTEEENYNN